MKHRSNTTELQTTFPIRMPITINVHSSTDNHLGMSRIPKIACHQQKKITKASIFSNSSSDIIWMFLLDTTVPHLIVGVKNIGQNGSSSHFRLANIKIFETTTKSTHFTTSKVLLPPPSSAHCPQHRNHQAIGSHASRWWSPASIPPIPGKTPQNTWHTGPSLFSCGGFIGFIYWRFVLNKRAIDK